MHFCRLIFPIKGANGPNRELITNPYSVHTLVSSIHGQKESAGRILWRLDEPIVRMALHPKMTLLIQASFQPDLEALRQNRLFPVGASIEAKEVDLRFSPGQLLRFQLRANPTRKSPQAGKKQGKRIPILDIGGLEAWFARKAEQGGFEGSLMEIQSEGPREFVRRGGKGPTNGMFHSIVFQGSLRVLDGERFRACVETGIGSGKGFGFGLLSLAPFER